jgi:hypothetical protein
VRAQPREPITRRSPSLPRDEGSESQPVELGGFSARIATLPLGDPWSSMREQLEQLLFGE